MLELFDYLIGKGATAGDKAKVFSHFTEGIRRAVGEEKNGWS